MTAAMRSGIEATNFLQYSGVISVQHTFLCTHTYDPSMTGECLQLYPWGGTTDFQSGCSLESFPAIQGLQLKLRSTTVSPICCDDTVHHLALGLWYDEYPYVASVYLRAWLALSFSSWSGPGAHLPLKLFHCALMYVIPWSPPPSGLLLSFGGPYS